MLEEIRADMRAMSNECWEFGESRFPAAHKVAGWFWQAFRSLRGDLDETSYANDDRELVSEERGGYFVKSIPDISQLNRQWFSLAYAAGDSWIRDIFLLAEIYSLGVTRLFL